MTLTLKDIPTLRYAYKFGPLKAAVGEKPRFPHNDALLDRVSLHQGTITDLEVDAIVNAANKSLLGGGGVDGAIHTAAGPSLREECRALGGCETGDAKITKGHKLPARHIIHTVGPIYSSYDAAEKADQLASCYKRCLELTVENDLKHVAFCSVSTGIYGYPIEDATHIALEVTRKFLDESNGDKIDRVIFVVWSNKDKWTYEELLPLYFPPHPENAGEASSEDSREESKEESSEASPNQ